jgi:outer membrane protein OmpA-like peptidoglycan-associated protein
LNYSAGIGGSISGSNPQLTDQFCDDATDVIAVPSSGYHFVSWSDGVLTSDRNDNGCGSDVTVTANFAVNPPPPPPPTLFSLNYLAGSNGTISGNSSQIISLGANGSAVIAVPESGYYFVSWSDGVTTATRSDSNISSSKTVVAIFSLQTFTLTYTPTANGTISGNLLQTVFWGASGSTVTAVANSGYQFTQWSDGNLNATRSESGVTQNRSFTANFVKSPVKFSITTTSGENGTIVARGLNSVNQGDSLEIDILPFTGYHIVSVLVDGINVGTPVIYTFTNISSDHTISATFTVDINGSSEPGGGGPGSVSGAGPLVTEGSDGNAKATESGVSIPVGLSNLLSGSVVQLLGQQWNIQISNIGQSRIGVQLPTGLQIYLYRGISAITKGSGFLPGSFVDVFIYSTRTYLGRALVEGNGTFKTTFQVPPSLSLGHHVIQVEGTTGAGQPRVAAVGMQIAALPKKNLTPITTVHYAVNVSNLNFASYTQLNRIISSVKSNGFREIWVYGYTDIQSGVDNILLSKNRAEKVVAYLQTKLPRLIIKYKYFGADNPVNSAHTQAAFAQNRRSEIFGQP